MELPLKALGEDPSYLFQLLAHGSVTPASACLPMAFSVSLSLLRQSHFRWRARVDNPG